MMTAPFGHPAFAVALSGTVFLAEAILVTIDPATINGLAIALLWVVIQVQIASERRRNIKDAEAKDDRRDDAAAKALAFAAAPLALAASELQAHSDSNSERLAHLEGRGGQRAGDPPSSTLPGTTPGGGRNP
jgi:hypothetical protein